MQLTCKVNQAEAIRRGFDTNSTVKLEIDPATLTQEQRETLAGKFKNGEFEVYGDNCLPEPTLSGLIESLDKITSDRKAEAAKKEKTKQDLLARFDANPRDIVFYTDFNDAAGFRNGFQSDWIDESRKAVFDATVADLKREDQEERAAKKAEEERLKAEREAKQAERDAKKAAATEELRTWAIAHGSETLRLRTEEDINWQSMALEEWATASLKYAGITADPCADPAGYDPDSDPASDPTADQILALRGFRKALESIPVQSDVELVDCTYTEQQEKDFRYEPEEPDVIRRSEFRVELHHPLGTITRYYLAE